MPTDTNSQAQRPLIPEPYWFRYFFFWKKAKCHCGKEFRTLLDYQTHYVMFHANRKTFE